ncbi:MAG: fructosamine kinase family protein [Balneolales bacterium]|nr:fructosamine kinase family protein [Balneolales bacterium]
MIPAALLLEIQHQLSLSAKPKFIKTLGGGSINKVGVIECASRMLVIKWNSPDLSDMFEKEAKGLEILRGAGTDFIIPEVFGSGRSEAFSWLVMEYLPEAQNLSDIRKSDAHFGQSLANLHNCFSTHFGLEHSNYIGRLPQCNKPEKNWPVFFWENRIKPQLETGIKHSVFDSSILNEAAKLEQLAGQLFPDEKPSLLHGDLWSGNFLKTKCGETALIDPAVYYGHREMEIAFTKLFGGFGSYFYDAYSECMPLADGYKEREPLCQLYPLLVHANLFGGGYTSQAVAIIRRYRS